MRVTSSLVLTGALLVEFLRRHRAEIRHVTGVRYSGELGHPFHVVDQDVVVLPLDHPFAPEGRFASLLVRDEELARNLTQGFETLWRKAMRNLQVINFDPRGPEEPSSAASLGVRRHLPHVYAGRPPSWATRKSARPSPQQDVLVQFVPFWAHFSKIVVLPQDCLSPWNRHVRNEHPPAA